MSRSLLVFIVVFFVISGCVGKSIKYESQDVERETKRKKIKILLEGYDFELRYKNYFVSMLKNYFLTGTDMVVVQDGSDFVSKIYISNVGYIVDFQNSIYRVRMDFNAVVDVESSEGSYFISNSLFSYTVITNMSFEVFSDPFRREKFLEDAYFKFLDDSALNFVYFIATGWKENYGYYTINYNIFQRILGVKTNEEATRKTNQRNIPIIGGERN